MKTYFHDQPEMSSFIREVISGMFLLFTLDKMNLFLYKVFIMKRKTVKTSIARLLKHYPYKHRYEMLAKELGITTRWVRLLEKGEKAPSEHLRRLIKVVLSDTMGR